MTDSDFCWFVLEPISEYIQDRKGEQKTFTNGVLSLYQEMVDGKEHGITRTYDENGNLEEETIYDKGKEISKKNIKK